MSSVTRIWIGKKTKIKEITQTDPHGEERKKQNKIKTNKFYINYSCLIILFLNTSPKYGEKYIYFSLLYLVSVL